MPQTTRHYEIYCIGFVGEAFDNFKIAIFVYVLCSHYKYNIFS